MKYEVLMRWRDLEDGNHTYDPARDDDNYRYYPRKGAKTTPERCQMLCDKGFIRPIENRQPEPIHHPAPEQPDYYEEPQPQQRRQRRGDVEL